MEKIKLIEIAIPPVKAVDTVCFFLEFGLSTNFSLYDIFEIKNNKVKLKIQYIIIEKYIF